MRKAALSIVMSLAVIQLATAYAAEIPWQTNLRDAHELAEKNSKLLLLHFYTDNCTWCDRLEKGSFTSPQVIETVALGFVPVKINAGSNPRLAEMFKVSKFPTDVVVTTGGKTLSHQVSPQKPNEYVQMLAGTRGGFPAPEGGFPAPEGGFPAPEGGFPAPEIAVASTRANSPSVSEPTPDYARPLPTATSLVARPASTKRDNESATAAQSVSVPVAKDPSTSLAGFRNQGLSLSPPANVSPPANAMSSNDKATGGPELAMEGFCPVTVISEDKWVEGKPEFGAIHLGKLYLFETAEKMNKFLADPVPFTPVLNEIDVVRFFEERTIVSGKREWGLKDPVYQRMFFFADEAAMNHFYNEYERYTDAAVDVMEKAIADSNPGT